MLGRSTPRVITIKCRAADAIVTAGYELQEFDPIRINPRGDARIIHIHRFPAEVDVHYDVAVGLHADIGRSLMRWRQR